MLSLEACANNIGERVRYAGAEHGVITEVRERYVMVRYGVGQEAKATPPQYLELADHDLARTWKVHRQDNTMCLQEDCARRHFWRGLCQCQTVLRGHQKKIVMQRWTAHRKGPKTKKEDSGA